MVTVAKPTLAYKTGIDAREEDDWVGKLLDLYSISVLCPKSGAQPGQNCGKDDGTEVDRFLHEQRSKPALKVLGWA